MECLLILSKNDFPIGNVVITIFPEENLEMTSKIPKNVKFLELIYNNFYYDIDARQYCIKVRVECLDTKKTYLYKEKFTHIFSDNEENHIECSSRLYEVNGYERKFIKETKSIRETLYYDDSIKNNSEDLIGRYWLKDELTTILSDFITSHMEYEMLCIEDKLNKEIINTIIAKFTSLYLNRPEWIEAKDHKIWALAKNVTEKNKPKKNKIMKKKANKKLELSNGMPF